MKKLEDIPRKTPFKVPDGYFDQLPNVVQARMAKEGSRSPLTSVLRFSLKYALPVAALIVAGIIWFRPGPSIEGQLGDIDADQVALYLDNTYANDDVNGDENLVEWTEEELNMLEDDVYSTLEFGDEFDDVLDDIDL